ncbi:FAD-binding oxidoreductase [Geodermatophilus sp. SYSU D00703]
MATLPPDLPARLRDRLSPASGLRDGVVHAACADDVVATVRLAGRHGVAVGVRGDGAPAGWRTLLVEPAGLDEVTVSPEGWARVGAGVRWAQLLAAAAAHSLTPLTGADARERVADSVTGGGVGPVARTYGLASDRVRAVELVTGDGVLRRVTAADEPELFWGVRGGAGVLGVVTAVELDLLAAGPLYASEVSWSPADAARVLRAWRAWSAELPAQAGTSAVLTGTGEGTAALTVRFAWTGDPSDGAAVLDRLWAVADPVAGNAGVRTVARLGPAPVGPGVESSLLLDELPSDGIGPLLRAAVPRAVELRLLGGAVAWVPQQPSAVCHRDARLAVRVVGGRSAEERAATWACAEELAAALAPATGGRAPAHGVGATPDVLARTPTPAVRERLAGLAAATDPHRILEGAGLGRRRSGPPAEVLRY